VSKKSIQSLPDVVDIGDAYGLTQGETVTLMNLLRVAATAEWITGNGESMFPCPCILPPSCIHQSQPTFSCGVKILKRFGIVRVVKRFQAPALYAINVEAIKRRVEEKTAA
jgi:hypothetical protein